MAIAPHPERIKVNSVVVRSSFCGLKNRDDIAHLGSFNGSGTLPARHGISLEPTRPGAEHVSVQLLPEAITESAQSEVYASAPVPPFGMELHDVGVHVGATVVSKLPSEKHLMRDLPEYPGVEHDSVQYSLAKTSVDLQSEV